MTEAESTPPPAPPPQSAPPPEDVNEAFLMDESAHTAYRLAGVVRIGRAPENTIVITDPTVSRLHAEVWLENGNAHFRSLGSNGTRINGTRIPGTHQLQEGDRIDLGWTSFEFTTRDLPLGVHAASRGIASASRRSTADPAQVAHSDNKRETVNVQRTTSQPPPRATPRDPMKTHPEVEPISRHTTRNRVLLLLVVAAVAAATALIALR